MSSRYRVYRGSYPVPMALCSSSFGPTATLDEMEIRSYHHSPAGTWAKKVLARENTKLLDALLGEDKHLPKGVLAAGSDDIVVGLVSSAGRVWRGDEWADEPLHLRTVELDEGDVAFVARSLIEGETAVVLSSSFPLAFIDIALTAAVETAPVEGQNDVPEGATVVAIVDSMDKNAVLELLAVAPGPKVLRRHAGEWLEDDGWLRMLKSVKPPPMVKLEAATVASVASQVDESTQGQEFEALKDNQREMYIPVVAAALIEELSAEADQRCVDMNLALVAVAGRELSPKDIKNTEKLRRYWLYGPGAAKIRWFTPGAWKRCYKNVVKYMGPKMAPGYCTNLSKRLGGPGVATHVGDRR